MAQGPIQNAQDAAIAQRVADLAAADPDLVKAIGAAAVGSQRVVFNLPYYSRIRFSTDRTGADPYAYDLEPFAGPTAFAYQQGQSMAPGGFPAAQLATDADTNLLDSQKTRDGQTLKIVGIALYALPDAWIDGDNTVWASDELFLAHLLSQVCVQVARQGGSQVDLYGPPIQIPQPGGQFGNAQTRVLQPGLQQPSQLSLQATNGLPVRGNFYSFPNPYYWTPSGQTDSTFSITFPLRRSFKFTNISARAGAAGVQAWTPPATLVQDFLAVLVSESSQPRGVNG